jgi:hypothetical protein
MTHEESTRIRSSVREQWRLRLSEEAQRDVGGFDPIQLGMKLARLLDDHADDIERDIAAEIEAVQIRLAGREGE